MFVGVALRGHPFVCVYRVGWPGRATPTKDYLAVRISSGKLFAPNPAAGALGLEKRLTPKSSEVREYCLIVEGAYLSESEAEHALRDPFIEDWVEQTGRFRLHNMNEIQ